MMPMSAAGQQYPVAVTPLVERLGRLLCVCCAALSLTGCGAAGGSGASLPLELPVAREFFASRNEIRFDLAEAYTESPITDIALSTSAPGVEMEFLADPDRTWLDVQPRVGRAPGTIQIRVLPGLAPSTYRGQVHLRAGDGSQSSQTITVLCTVTAAGRPLNPEILTYPPRNVSASGSAAGFWTA